MRRAPSPGAKRALKRFAAVIAGKAVVLKPAKAKSYGKIFKRVGNKVIVPRRKGERVRVDKKGVIRITRKIGGRTVQGRYRKLAELDAGVGKIYALPLGNGWQKFDSKAELERFVYVVSPKVGETYKNWSDYVVELDVGDDDDEDNDNDRFDKALRRQLNKRIRKRRAARRKK